MMSNSELQKLCLNLLHADSEQDVIGILDSVGLWTDDSVWRYYGDYEGNYNTIGNQQSSSDAALVEKIINSVDARLMNACLAKGIRPDSSQAPHSIHEAVAVLIRGGKPGSGVFSGRLSDWGSGEIQGAAKDITVSATGFMPSEGKPCLTISDSGEGQTPMMFPETFLSLTRANKRRIPFVQGRFNMGGTGALKFSGRSNLQLIISRRNPKLVSGPSSSDQQWGFTIVRRESPSGNVRNSMYTYLAPVGADRQLRSGHVLSFSADGLPIFPEANKPYARESEHGTLVKLFEYDVSGSKTHILRKGGLLARLELLMPEVALPVRLHECRKGYRGHEGSFDTTLAGLRVRLESDRRETSDNLEEGCPWTSTMTIHGERIVAAIYVFKRGRSEAYKRSEGILFTMNGQTHASLSNDFFRRKNVGLSYLADSLLVVLDCTAFTVRSVEDLFMNSRDRLSEGELRKEIENELASILKSHEGLRALKEKRRREEIEERIGDEKPLEDVLKSLLRDSPALHNLFLPGSRISDPFKRKKVQTGEKPYRGAKFPTFFRFKAKEYDARLEKECPIDRRCRIAFDTDAENDYFDRQFDPGVFSLFLQSGDRRSELANYSLNLHNGTANLTLALPDNCNVGDKFNLLAVTADSKRVFPFENVFSVKVLRECGPSKGGNGNGRKPRTEKEGEDEDAPAGIQLPNITRVYEEPRDGAKGWKDMDPCFDRFSALRIRNAGPDGDMGSDQQVEVYDFFVNMDNVYLNTELKGSKLDAELLRARFMYGMVLVGLGLLHQNTMGRKKNEDIEGDSREREDDIEQKVEFVSAALAPVLLPMIDSLGALDIESSDDTEARSFGNQLQLSS